MKRTWARFEAVMKQGSEGEIATLPLGNPEGEKRGPGAVKRSTKLCSGESQSEKHDEARDPPPPRVRGKLPPLWSTPIRRIAYMLREHALYKAAHRLARRVSRGAYALIVCDF